MVFIGENNTIKRAFIIQNRVFEWVNNSDGEINEVDIINITNWRSVKIKSQSRSKITKFEYLV